MLMLNINWPAIGYLIFISIILLIMFAVIISKKLEEKNEKKALEKAKEEAEAEKAKNVSGVENVAIAMAIYLYYNEIFNSESDIITIKRVVSRYSPWNSKIYGIQ